MLKRKLLLTALTGVLSCGIVPAWAEDQDRTQDRDAMENRDRAMDQESERIYGSQMMTQEERNAYRARLQAAKTEEERERIRKEHHQLMQQRAKERGLTLPDEPRGWDDRGPGSGMGSGMGSGAGSGGGGGKR
jgi:hypothetical protein